MSQPYRGKPHHTPLRAFAKPYIASGAATMAKVKSTITPIRSCTNHHESGCCQAGASRSINQCPRVGLSARHDAVKNRKPTIKTWIVAVMNAAQKQAIHTRCCHGPTRRRAGLAGIAQPGVGCLTDLISPSLMTPLRLMSATAGPSALPATDSISPAPQLVIDDRHP